MDDTKSPTSSMESTGDTSRLLKELMDLQKSTASSVMSIDQSLDIHDSHETAQTIPGMVQNSGDATDPTLTELMKTIYDGNAARQLITLQGSDTANSFSVYGKEVDIVSSKQTGPVSRQSLAGSNKVKITPVVNYDWEHRRYVGNLVALHRNNMFAAYVLKGKAGGVVRVNNRKTAERHLLKDFVGRVIDLAFAQSDDVMLAVVDEIGNLCVYDIKQTDDRKIISSLILHVQRPEKTVISEYHRVIWCPYIPDDADDSSATESSSIQDNPARVLVLTNDEKAEIWSVDLVTKDHGAGPVYPHDVEMGLIQIDSHTKPIMDAAFSPDGTALATASLDGEVKFFQVYMHEGTSPRCLHQWKPHGGKPMSCLFFLDDHKNFSPDAQFWKFAVTGADNNQEVKIWSCESWNCLQTVRFLCPSGLPSNFSVDPCMKAALDLSARYLVLSDIKRKVLYVLQIHQDGVTNTAHISSVSEFTLTQPCLSFAILDAGTKLFKKSTGNDSHLDEITTGEIDGGDDGEDDERRQESTSGLGVQIKLYTVHPKALQELLIRFKPESSAPQPTTPSVSSISQSDVGVMDALSDVSMGGEADSDRVGDLSFSALDSGGSTLTHPILMTPDAFTSSPRKQYADDSLLDSVRGSGASNPHTQYDDSTLDGVRGSASSTSSFTQVSAMQEDLLSPRSSASSSITQPPTTPTADPPAPSRPDAGDTTPGSLPLPPVTASEETELATPTSSRDVHPGEVTPTPQSQHNVDDFFSQASERQDVQNVTDSTESSGLYEVGEGRSHQKSQGSYDEMDEEVAGVMGDDDDDICPFSDGQPDGTQPFDGGDLGAEVTLGTSGSEGEPVLRAWPKPPDVGGDGHRLADDSAQDGDLTEDNNDGDNDDDNEDDNDDEDDEDDVVVEDEEVEEEDGRKDGDIDIEEDIDGDTEDIDEEQEPSQDSVESKNEPKPAPVAGSTTYTALPRDRLPVQVREIHTETVREILDQKELQRLHTSIESLVSAMVAQQQQLSELRCEMAEQRGRYEEAERRLLTQDEPRPDPATDATPSIEEHLGKLEGIITARIERLFSQHSQRENQRMQETLRQMEVRDQQKQERLFSSVNQTLTSAVASNLDRTIKHEMKHSVVPGVGKALEPMKEQIHQEMAQKLTATDSLLKDNIGKMVRSRQTIEAMGMAAGSAIQQPIQAAYREAFQNIVIPTFERATHTMYQQVSDAFQKGTKEYTQQLEGHLDTVRQKQLELRDPVVGELRKLTDTFHTSAEQMKSHVLATIQSQLSSQLQTSLTTIQENLVGFVRDAIREEVSLAVREQGSTISDSVLQAMRSGAVTPLPVTPDPQIEKTHVLNLLRQGQLNAAFQQALSASNLELVMMLCEAVNPAQVFNQEPCPLQQPVLLSLIQQLSADLDASTELKHKYLEEAVMNLDPQNSVTQEHLKGVLYGLVQKLKVYIQAHPNAKTTRGLKMLLMASESLLK